MRKAFGSAALLIFLFACLPSLSAQSAARSKPGARPSYCNPCLFYGGDFGSNESGIENGDTVLASFTEILVPFDVPTGQIWKATGLFTNNLATMNDFDPKQAMWSLRQDVQSGDCGTLLASGDSAAQVAPTGNNVFGISEYTVSVKIPPLQLSSGRYWLSVVPECLNSGDSLCSAEQFYISAFQGTGAGAYGPPEPNNDAFSSASLSGGSCALVSGVEFSAGVLGASDTP